MRPNELKTYDLVGVGFGPSNLALAVALDELKCPISAMFLERQPSFGWHRAMLLPSTKMQVSFLKDLVTFRNPMSPFSFVAYLHAVGRLSRFVNNKDFFPTRLEFNDYLKWVGANFADRVEYGSEVTALRLPEGPAATADHILVTARTAAGGERTIAARNVVISTGLVARMPEGIRAGERIWHSSEFLVNLERWGSLPLRRVAVVGAGQSAAEIARHFHAFLGDASIHAVIPSYGYMVADNSPLANEVFDPEAVDDYYDSSEWSKESLWNYHRNTNYSVVDEELINDLYQRMYQDRVAGRERLELLRMTRLERAQPIDGGVRLTVRSELHDVRQLDVDVVVCATGYRPMSAAAVLGDLEPYCQLDNSGMLRVGRDYRLMTDPALGCAIYLQGGTEHSHGLSSSLLSNIAVRSGEIARSVAARQLPPQPGNRASFGSVA